MLIDEIVPDGVALLEDLIYDADAAQNLHVLLDSPGGDGETALGTGRDLEAVEALARALHEPLIEAPHSHAAVFGAAAGRAAGLPVQKVDPRSSQWQAVWRLYMKYRTLPPRHGIHEGLQSPTACLPSRSADRLTARPGASARCMRRAHPNRSAQWHTLCGTCIPPIGSAQGPLDWGRGGTGCSAS